MNCEEVAKRLAQQQTPTPAMLEHVKHCSKCMARSGIEILLPALHKEPSSTKPAAPGEEQFLSRLLSLGQAKTSQVERASCLHEMIQQGDRLFWRNDYDAAIREYRNALLLIDDRQGKAALKNKLARALMHRHRSQEALMEICEALDVLDEQVPPTTQKTWHIWKQQFVLWAMLCLGWLRQHIPALAPKTVEYGDRSLAAQHLYRELSVIAQGTDDAISRWAHLREMQWALRLDKPLELVVSWGRHAVRALHQKQGRSARHARQRIQALANAHPKDALTQAAARFYQGRVAYLNEDLEQAKAQLEQCVDQCSASRDDFLREASMQHLVRVYRNAGLIEEALHMASQLLSMYHKIGNLPRLSASCRHFALCYAANGDMRRAKAWAFKALEVIEESALKADDRMLSLLRCYVLLADIELRCGRKEHVRRYLGEAIRLKRHYHLPADYFRDGAMLLRKVLDIPQPTQQRGLLSSLGYWLSERWAVMRGDLETAHHLQHKPEHRPQTTKVPAEIAYLYQEASDFESGGSGIRATLPASGFANAFLRGDVEIQSRAKANDAELIASMFPVGAVSSRWGRGSLATQLQGNITTQFSNASESPWGYFFADDIG